MMDEPRFWMSPDKQITKEILKNGIWGPKPTLNCECRIKISNLRASALKTEIIRENTEITVVIGETDTPVDRELDKCLQNMHSEEVAYVAINLKDNNEITETISFNIQLLQIITKGQIYEWTAEQKYNLALKHKEKGVELYKSGRIKDASHRFSRSLTLLHSIPIAVDNDDDNVHQFDGTSKTDIEKLKMNLYNNLASCHLRTGNNDFVVDLCNRILNMDKNNAKAVYKRGFAYANICDYDKAKIDLSKALESAPHNQELIEKYKYVNMKCKEFDDQYVSIVKKMFNADVKK